MDEILPAEEDGEAKKHRQQHEGKEQQGEKLLGGLAAQKCSLPRLLHAVEISGAVCLLAAILLLLCCRRVRVGATLTATGLAALLLLLPALLLNLPGLLHPLSSIAQAQFTRALLLLGGAQAVFALVTLLPGILLLRRAHA